MEPDTVAPHPLSPTAAQGTMSNPTSPAATISSFISALAALKQHTFRNASLPSTSAQAKDLYHQTHAIINTASASTLSNARNSLHPIDDFLAFISLLHASLAVTPHDDPSAITPLLADFRAIVNNVDPSWARAVPQRWVGVARHAVRIAVDGDDTSQCAQSLVVAVQQAADMLRTRDDEVVPIDADFLAVCIRAKQYRLAARWLRQRRRMYINSASQIEATDVHLVYHYAAIVFTAVSDFAAAFQSTRLALAVPASSPGMYMQAIAHTYRFHILLSLLVSGKNPEHLKFSSYQSASLRKMTSEYMELAAAYESRNVRKLRQVIESNHRLFEKHCTLALVNQLVDGLFKQRVTKLSDLYMTLTLDEVTSKVGLKSDATTQALLLEMVETGAVNARIDERGKVVRLREQEFKTEEELSEHASTKSLTNCLEVMTRLQRLREQMDSDPLFVKREMAAQDKKNQSGSSGRFGAAGSAVMGLGIAELDSEQMR